MSEKRKADAVVTFQARDGIFQKFELFNAQQFASNSKFAQLPQEDSSGDPTVRVRHNGAWLPSGQQTLLTIQDAFDLVERTARRHLKSEK